MGEQREVITADPYIVGKPPARPDGKPKFAAWTEKPSDLSRPNPTTCSAPDTHDHAHGLIRVLSDAGDAEGEWNPEIDDATLLEGLGYMMKLRIFDDRMIKMQRTGKLSFYMRSLGEEAIAIAQTMALKEQDWIFPTYRQPGAQFVRGRDLVSMINHCVGNIEDNVKGRQMPVHYTWKEGRFISVSSPVGTQFSQAIGVAMASAYKGLDEACITWIGEGASAEGDYHYAVNFASTFKPPVILCIVNNQWAISTHQNLATGGRNFAARGLAYDIPCLRVDGNDFLAVFAVTQWARQRIDAGLGPTHMELYTYRAGPHSSSDDPSVYRHADEADYWPGGDPVERLKQHAIKKGIWSEEKHSALEKILDDEIMSAYKEAVKNGDLANGPYPPASTIFTEVYEEIPWHIQEQREELGK